MGAGLWFTRGRDGHHRPYIRKHLTHALRPWPPQIYNMFIAAALFIVFTLITFITTISDFEVSACWAFSHIWHTSLFLVQTWEGWST